MVFNCTIMSSPLHSTSLQRQVRDELWCTRSLLQEHFFLCFGRRILAGLFLRLVRLLKKCLYSCSCWAFCSSRSIKEPIEHPHNFYFGGLTPFPNKLKAKDNCIFKKRSQNLIIEKKKKYSPDKLCLLLHPERCDFLQTMCQYCSFLKSLSLSIVNIMILPLPSTNSLDFAMCS